MFSEHHDMAATIKTVLADRLHDQRKVYSLEVNVLDLKTFEILLMDRQAIIGIEEATRIASEDDSVIKPLLGGLCREVRTASYDRRALLVHTRQVLYQILEEAGLESEFRKEFVSGPYEQEFKEEEKSDDRSKLLEVALEVDWLKSRIARALSGQSSATAAALADSGDEPQDMVEVSSDSNEIRVEIEEAQ